LEIAELLPALFRKPFYDYKEWWGYFWRSVFTYLQGIVFYWRKIHCKKIPLKQFTKNIAIFWGSELGLNHSSYLNVPQLSPRPPLPPREENKENKELEIKSTKITSLWRLS
jgi:hypothetical protein